MKFQYFSDIHTELYKSNPGKLKKLLSTLEVRAPYLILAGDIGHPHSEIYKDFLSYLSPLFTNVFIIAGNHEYYMTPSNKKYMNPEKDWLSQIQSDIKSIANEFNNIVFLENEVFNIPDSDVVIFGATFWSDIKKQEELYIQNCIMDNRCIPDFTPQRARMLHKQSCKILNEALEKYPDKKFVVISHHLPSYSLVNAKYINMTPPLNSAYASNIEEAYKNNIVAWFAGHTHIPIEKGKFHVNPIGYMGENPNLTFNKTCDIE